MKSFAIVFVFIALLSAFACVPGDNFNANPKTKLQGSVVNVQESKQVENDEEGAQNNSLQERKTFVLSAVATMFSFLCHEHDGFFCYLANYFQDGVFKLLTLDHVSYEDFEEYESLTLALFEDGEYMAEISIEEGFASGIVEQIERLDIMTDIFLAAQP